MNIQKLHFVFFVFVGVVQATVQIANAQSTVYLSYLGDTNSTGYGVESDFSHAVSFTTGTTVNGYNLDSIQLRIAAVSGNPSGFNLSLYGDNGGVPGNSLELLSGSIPTGAGIYTFTASDITLAPSTIYWAVATSPDSSGSGNTAYWAFYSNDYTSSDGWNLSATPNAYSFNGSDWYAGGSGSPLTIAISAYAVPEPEIYSLIGLGLFAILLRRTK